MTSSSQLGRKKAAVGVGAVLLLAASLITVAVAVSAQSGPTADCSSDNAIQFGTEYFGSEDLGNHLLSTGPTEFTADYALAAGTYDVSYVSTDGYTGRDLVTQVEEQWFAQFLGADGSVLATTGVTADVPDLIETGVISGSIGEVELAADATSIRLVHIAPGAAVPNSVRPVCIGATPTGDAPVDLDSSITVDFDSENVDPSTITVVCGDETQTGTGTAVDLVIDPVAPGTTCTVTSPTSVCTAVAPAGTDAADAGTDAAGTECTIACSSVDVAGDAADGDAGADGSTPATCTVPADVACTMSVSPENQIDLVVADGVKTITFPTDVSVDVVVDIDCNAPDQVADPDVPETVVEGEVVTNDPDPADPTPVDPADPGDPADDGDSPTTEVLDEVVTAPVAQVQPGDPTFTG